MSDRPTPTVSSTGLPIEAVRCTWDGYGEGARWVQYHDKSDPLPTEWEGEEPDEVASMVLSIDADSAIETLRTTSIQQRGLLLWALWHHQGASSHIGQPIRKSLGIDQHTHLTAEQIQEGKDAAAAAMAPPVNTN